MIGILYVMGWEGKVTYIHRYMLPLGDTYIRGDILHEATYIHRWCTYVRAYHDLDGIHTYIRTYIGC